MADDIQDLIQRAKAGEKKAWDVLVQRYSSLVWGILIKFDNVTRTEQEDLFQDVFTVLLNGGIEKFRGVTEHEWRSYLKRITVNETLSLLRLHGRRFEMPGSFLGPQDEKAETFLLGEPLDFSPGPEDQTIGKEALSHLLCCVQTLPLVDQEIFWSRVRAYSYNEIVRLLDLPQGTVASKYNRAREKIRTCLEQAGIL